jgi:hypothetical protein
LTPRSARTPATISFTRISMGCVKIAFMPEHPHDGAHGLDELVLGRPARPPLARRQGDEHVGELEPIGSVATSAVPVRVQMRSISSGKACSSTRSICVP